MYIYTLVGNLLNYVVTSIMNDSNTDEDDETAAGKIIYSSVDWNETMVFILLA